MQTSTHDEQARRRWMGVLAKADPPHLARLWDGLADVPGWDYLRRPEIGLVMVQGRMGGDGGAFNLGEMTVTRCSVRVRGGSGQAWVGHAWVAGRSLDHARIAALADALMQDRGWRDVLAARVLEPLEQAYRQQKDEASRKAAATRVDFFTMVRGED